MRSALLLCSAPLPLVAASRFSAFAACSQLKDDVGFETEALDHFIETKEAEPSKNYHPLDQVQEDLVSDPQIRNSPMLEELLPRVAALDLEEIAKQKTKLNRTPKVAKRKGCSDSIKIVTDCDDDGDDDDD